MPLSVRIAEILSAFGLIEKQVIQLNTRPCLCFKACQLLWKARSEISTCNKVTTTGYADIDDAFLRYDVFFFVQCIYVCICPHKQLTIVHNGWVRCQDKLPQRLSLFLGQYQNKTVCSKKNSNNNNNDLLSEQQSGMPMNSMTFSNPKLLGKICSKNYSLEFFVFAVFFWLPMKTHEVCSVWHNTRLFARFRCIFNNYSMSAR